MAARDSLLRSDDEEELVFDQTGLLTNKLSSRHGVSSRTYVVNSGGRLTIARTINLCLSFFGLVSSKNRPVAVRVNARDYKSLRI